MDNDNLEERIDQAEFLLGDEMANMLNETLGSFQRGQLYSIPDVVRITGQNDRDVLDIVEEAA